MNIKVIKRALRLHLLTGICCLAVGLAGCGNSTNEDSLNAETDSSEALPEKETDLNFGIFSNSLDVESAQTNRGRLKSSSELGNITFQDSSDTSSNTAENPTTTSSSTSDSCLNIGEGQSSCSSSSGNSDGSSSSNASAEATGDSTVTETNTSEDGSSSSSSSSHNENSGSLRSNQATTEGSLLVEHPGEDSGDSAENLELYTVGESGLYFGQIIPDDKQVESSNINTNKTIKKYTSGLILAAEKSTEIRADTLSGEYGFVGIESNLVDEIKFLGVVGEKFVSDDMHITESRSNQFSILRSAGGDIVALEDASLHDATSFDLDPTGSIIGIDSKARGFINQNTGALVYFGQTPTRNSSHSENSSGLSIALQLPTSTPNLAGQTYRLFSMTTGLNEQGIELGAITSGEMIFNSDNTVSLKDLVVQKSVLPFTGGDISLSTTTRNDPNLPFVLEENGLIKITGIETAEGKLELEGYVSANGEMTIMRSTLTNEASNQFEIGMVVGIIMTP